MNKAEDIFTKKVSHILDRMAPVKKSTKNCPWLTQDSKTLINEINKAQELFDLILDHKTQEHLEKFKKLRNEVTKRLRNDNLIWQKQKLESCGTNSGKL